MIRILNILTGGISSDGISSAWLNVCKEWNRSSISENLKLDFLCIEELSDSDSINEFLNLGFEIFYIPSRQSTPIKYFKALRKLLKKNDYDIVHVNGSSSFMLIEMLAAKLENIKVRISHSHNTTCSKLLLHKILKLPFLMTTNKRIACGKNAGKWLFGKNPFIIFHNGIQLQKFGYDKEIRRQYRKKLGLKDNTTAIAHVGKFNNQKNHNFLIQIFSQIYSLKSSSHLFLYGDGPLLPEIMNLVKNMGIEDKVSFMGVVSNIENYLQAMDLMLLPSLFEGLPNVVVEWQANGLPSIISDSVTDECSVTNFTQFLSLKEQPEKWAEECLKILGIYNNRECQSVEGRDKLTTSGFEISNQVELLHKIYSR